MKLENLLRNIIGERNHNNISYADDTRLMDSKGVLRECRKGKRKGKSELTLNCDTINVRSSAKEIAQATNWRCQNKTCAEIQLFG